MCCLDELILNPLSSYLFYTYISQWNGRPSQPFCKIVLKVLSKRTAKLFSKCLKIKFLVQPNLSFLFSYKKKLCCLIKWNLFSYMIQNITLPCIWVNFRYLKFLCCKNYVNDIVHIRSLPNSIISLPLISKSHYNTGREIR